MNWYLSKNLNSYLGKIIQAFIVILFLVAYSGCCRVPRPNVPDSTADLLEVIRAEARDLPTIRGELRVDHMGPEGRIAGKVYAFASVGGRLRLEAVSPLDTPIRTVAVDGNRFALIDQESHRCLQGAAEPCLVGEAVGIELSPEHVAIALVGAAPIIRHRSIDTDWNSCGYYEVELEGQEEGVREEIRLEQQEGRLVVTQVKITDSEGPILEMSFSGHELAEGRQVPRRLTLSMPRSEAELRVEWRELEVGVSLPERAWQITCPEGFSLEEASCRSRGDLPLFEEIEEAAPPQEETEEPGPESPRVDDPPSDDPEEIDLSEELGF